MRLIENMKAQWFLKRNYEKYEKLTYGQIHRWMGDNEQWVIREARQRLQLKGAENAKREQSFCDTMD